MLLLSLETAGESGPSDVPITLLQLVCLGGHAAWERESNVFNLDRYFSGLLWHSGASELFEVVEPLYEEKIMAFSSIGVVLKIYI